LGRVHVLDLRIIFTAVKSSIQTRMMYKTFSLCAMALVFSSSFVLAQVDTAAISDKLNRSSKQIGRDVVCLISKDGKVIYKKESPEFGVKTQQRIGATSQWLTAALVLTYVQEGKISLDDKVSDYIPYYTKYSKSYITIRHCLTHQTGVQSDPGIIKYSRRAGTKLWKMKRWALHPARK
jgi:CubicO group peptidase (beta-lactamase class C family)